MKTFFHTKTLVTLAVALAVAAVAVSQAPGQPVPAAAGDSALPADIVPGSPLAEVVKMVQAGVEVGTINSFIVNSQSAFNLDADKIIFLKDEGVPSDLVNAMIERDKVLYASTVNPPPAPPVQMATDSDTAPPSVDVNVNYFDDTLTPYGSWVDVDGYGRCWRPTVVIYDPSWQPYCDRGHWVYTDYGWYWDSDYSWGVTFHYGRWFRNARYGWCWYPDTVWAPSWVTWRSNGDYCGWAPLPPLAVFDPGVGFFFNGVSVGLDFDFGLDAGCFTFISPAHFCDRRPRSFCVAPARVAQIFRSTTVINNFNVNNRTMVNGGIPVGRISGATHRPIEPVHVGSLPNAGRQGWRGEGFDRSSLQRGTAGNAGRNTSSGNTSTGNSQLRHGPAILNSQNNNNANNNANDNRRESFGQPVPGTRQNGNQPVPFNSQIQSRQQPAGNDRIQPQNNDWQQNRTVERPAAIVPPQRAEPQLEQREIVPPSPPRVEEAPRNYSPPPQPPPPPSEPSAPARSSEKDKQNQ
jgi:hypothetical protein